jgi:hypothetical protein
LIESNPYIRGTGFERNYDHVAGAHGMERREDGW